MTIHVLAVESSILGRGLWGGREVHCLAASSPDIGHAEAAHERTPPRELLGGPRGSGVNLSSERVEREEDRAVTCRPWNAACGLPSQDSAGLLCGQSPQCPLRVQGADADGSDSEPQGQNCLLECEPGPSELTKPGQSGQKSGFLSVTEACCPKPRSRPLLNGGLKAPEFFSVWGAS